MRLEAINFGVLKGSNGDDHCLAVVQLRQQVALGQGDAAPQLLGALSP